MKLKNPWLLSLGGFLSASLIRGWMSTLEYRVALYDPKVDPVHPEHRGQKIYVFWHEYILLPVYARGHNNLAMLISRHGDAELLSRAAYHLGFECVRGSTNRGGYAALRELLDRSQSMHLAITPDGPRGPRRQLAPGAVFLASRLGLPLVCMGFGCDRPWRIRSWDRFAIPRPYSRARAVVSPEIRLPADLDRDGLEHYRVQVERMLTRLTLEAEAWAESGTHKREETPARREHAPAGRLRFDPLPQLSAPHANSAARVA